MRRFIHILPVIALFEVPVQVMMTAEKTRTLPLPPILGAISLSGGIVLQVAGKAWTDVKTAYHDAASKFK